MTVLKAVPPSKTAHRKIANKPKINGKPPRQSSSDEPLWPISVPHYHQMIEVGILTEDDPVELLAGRLIQKMPKGPRHSNAIHTLRRDLEKIFVDDWFVEPQDAITLSDSEPEPDIIVARGTAKQFQNRHPNASEVVLVIEVADATLYRDRGTKKRMYARAAIPVYWIVNLINNQIEVYQDVKPEAKEPTYATRHDYQLGEMVPVMVAGETIGLIDVSNVIPVEVES
jgi:Uma2 family endonuclease